MIMDLNMDKLGLIPAIIQDSKTNNVLMLGYISPESLEKTIDTGEVWFYSRSRQELWHKGDTSGNFFKLKACKVDCDGDSLLLSVDPTGPACHTGKTSCFFEELSTPQKFNETEADTDILDRLFSVIEQRKEDLPENSYTSSLFKKGTTHIAQKVIEEAGEAALSASSKGKEDTIGEIADLFYHTLVLMSSKEITPKEIWSELQSRQRNK